MSKAITGKSADHSGRDSFSYSFFCDICGKEWKSETTAFSGMGSTAIENEEARQIIWAEEHRLAFEAANLEARLKFALCPVCGRRVCDDCFDLGNARCSECNAKEKEIRTNQNENRYYGM